MTQWGAWAESLPIHNAGTVEPTRPRRRQHRRLADRGMGRTGTNDTIICQVLIRDLGGEEGARHGLSTSVKRGGLSSGVDRGGGG